MQIRLLLLSVTVIIQFLLELTVGRVFLTPSLLPLVLVYFAENHGSRWAVDGAFWSGLCLDLLLHQPPGSSSLALLAGLYAAGILGEISAGEGRGSFLLMAAVAVVVSDSVFIIVASRPFGSGFSSMLLLSLPRLLITTVLGALIISASIWFTHIRAHRVSG